MQPFAAPLDSADTLMPEKQHGFFKHHAHLDEAGSSSLAAAAGCELISIKACVRPIPLQPAGQPLWAMSRTSVQHWHMGACRQCFGSPGCWNTEGIAWRG